MSSRRVYVDTSALALVLVDQPGSDSVVEWLDGSTDCLISSDLLELELRRVALRHDISLEFVARIIDGVELHTLDHSLFHMAGLLPMKQLRSLEVLHLAAALRTGASAMLTFDPRLAEACREVGLEVIEPR